MSSNLSRLTNIYIVIFTTPLSYNKHISTRVDKTLGYVYFLDAEHPLSNKSKKVYYHRHVASLKIGKWIDSSYHVHHIDGNRQNNDPTNLEVLSPRAHKSKHRKSGLYASKVRKCLQCNKKFITRTDNFCSLSCASSNRFLGGVHNKVTKDELIRLVWSMPIRDVAKKFNCSDTMIHRLCKRWNIEKPKMGHWLKNKL